MPDSNDIVFTSYGIDIRQLIENLVRFFGGDALSLTGFFELISNIWFYLTIVGIILAVLFVIIFIYATVKVNQFGALEIKTWATDPERLWRERNSDKHQNQHWADIEKRLDSDNPSEWRVAIIEADILLGEVLNGAGYVGTSIGEQLKNANPNNFGTVEIAWQAHRVRNEIAHAGSDFVLTHKLARETITQYRQVFSEFGAI